MARLPQMARSAGRDQGVSVGGPAGGDAQVPPEIVEAFAPALIAWQRRSGRHGLPWQGTRDPYRVWLSEIMLQQTQVATVLSYYPRFLARFPDVQSLADGHIDEVMALWSGLGYYSRARHLHRCAQVVVSEHGGCFPDRAAELQRLPGIGASTAAAIAAFCHGERISIADGNVRRVLSRVLADDGDMATALAQQRLWRVAQELAPPDPTEQDMQAYTQGLMDLGATVCTRSRPACVVCPMADICRGRREGEPTRYPFKSRRVARRHESWWLLVALGPDGAGNQQVWLQRRPDTGIWAGLQCVPVFTTEADAMQCLGDLSSQVQALAAVPHALTHRELRLHPLVLTVPPQWVGPGEGRWHRVSELGGVGLPAPVRELMSQLS